MSEEQITVKQAARLCNVTLSSIYRMIQTGRIPQTIKGFLPKADVVEYKRRLDHNRELALIAPESKSEGHG